LGGREIGGNRGCNNATEALDGREAVEIDELFRQSPQNELLALGW